MKFTVMTLVAFLTAGSVGARAAEIADAPFRELNFAEAEKAAAKENKIVFIDFFTTWCGPCKQLDRTTWRDAKVLSLLEEKTVALKIDAEKENALSEHYHIVAYPTLLLLRADGTEIDRLVGYHEPAVFTEEFEEALSGKNSVARAHERVAKEETEGNLQKVVQARFQEAQTLAQAGKNKEALEEMLWCYDEGMVQSPAFGGVRNSFLISNINQLGKVYPLAKEALLERRDRALAKVNASESDVKSAMDLAALNRVLDENEKTLALFDRLPPNDLRRRGLITTVYTMLIEAHRYDDAYAARNIDVMLSEFNFGASQIRNSGNDANHASIYRNYMIRSTVPNIEVLLGSHHLREAADLRDKLLAIDASPETLVALQGAAAATGNPQFVVAPK